MKHQREIQSCGGRIVTRWLSGLACVFLLVACSSSTKSGAVADGAMGAMEPDGNASPIGGTTDAGVQAGTGGISTGGTTGTVSTGGTTGTVDAGVNTRPVDADGMAGAGGTDAGVEGGAKDAPVVLDAPATSVFTVTRTGAGNVKSSPAGIDCGSTCIATFVAGTTVTLTAVADAGYTFSGWTGEGCTGTAECKIVFDGSATVWAQFTPVSAQGTQYVGLDLLAAPAAARVPLRTGVPFPVGAVKSLDSLRLENADGTQEIPAQFNALAKWPDGSLKAVLVQLVGNLGPAVKYRVAYGAEVRRAAPAQQISVAQENGVAVSAGSVRFTVNPKGVLDGLWRDVDGDGKFSTDEQLLAGGDISAVNAFDGLEYTAGAGPDATVTIEENGPMRAVVKTQGALVSSSQAVLVKYLARYYASVGSDKVDVELTIIDDRLEKDVEKPGPNLALSIKGLSMRWAYTADGASYRFGGESGVHAGTDAGEHYLLQTGAFHYVDGSDQGHTFAYSGVGKGSKAPGWLSFGSGSRQLTVMIKDFWQQFPIELDLDTDKKTITAGLFPARSIAGAADISPISPGGTEYRRPNTLYFVRPGGAKTYQMRLVAHAESPLDADLSTLSDSYQRHRLDLVASLDWYTSSGVWGDINVGWLDQSTGYDSSLLKDIYIPSVETAGAHDATMFGWRDFGDRLRAGWADVQNGLRIPSWYDDTHIGANAHFKQFLRTGEQRWYGLAEIATRHFMDVDVSHGPRQGYWNTGGQPQPAGELKCRAHDNVDHEERNLHTGHAHVSGLSELYLLTGDKRSLDVLSEIGNWWKFQAPFMFAKFDPSSYREAERDFAYPLYVMNEYARVTGDDAYHREVAGLLVKYLISWWQTPLAHYGYNPDTDSISDTTPVGTNDASKGTGYWTMARMDNNAGYQKANGTNPWMAGPLISSIIRFYEQDTQFAAVGKDSDISPAVIKDMLLQTMDYVVKYGYKQSCGNAKTPCFVYSEVARDTDGGDTLILYNLAYLDRLYKQEQAANRLPNVEWYKTQPQWLPIATRRYDEMRTMKIGTFVQAWGFYGYECIFPPDFFKIMHDTLSR
jgi:uncharacterized repeat protein (TIGR02543 family)